MLGLGRPFFSLFPFTCTFVSGILLLYMARRSSSLHTPFGYPLGPPSPPSPQPLVPCKDPLASQPHSYASRNSIHCPLQTFSSSFSSSGTYDLNDGKSRVKEKGDKGIRSSRKNRKTKKERESHLQIHSYIIQRLSSWKMDLCSLHLTLMVPSVHSSPRWRAEMSSELGQFPKTRCGKVLFGIHEHNRMRLLLLPCKN